MGVVVKSPKIEREEDKGYGLAIETPPIHTVYTKKHCALAHHI